MNRKILALMAALPLAVSASVTSLKVEAQSLVETALFFVVVSFAEDEEALIYRLPRGGSQGNPRQPVGLGDTATFVISVTNTGDATCTQTVQASVAATSGLKILKLSRIGEFLSINGEEAVEVLDDCFIGAGRAAYVVGVSLPPDIADQLALNSNTAPAESGASFLSDIWGWTVVDSNGATVTSNVSVFGGGVFIYDVTNP